MIDREHHAKYDAYDDTYEHEYLIPLATTAQHQQTEAAHTCHRAFHVCHLVGQRHRGYANSGTLNMAYGIEYVKGHSQSDTGSESAPQGSPLIHLRTHSALLRTVCCDATLTSSDLIC